MNAEDLKTESHIAPFIRIVKDELKIQKDAFDTFVDGVHDPVIRSGF
jgi:hypothetical protein